MRFPSKIDRWLIVVTAASLGAGIFSAVASGSVVAYVALAVAGGMVLWLLLQTDYELTESQLRIRCGFYRASVPLDAIYSVGPSSNPLSAPALSLDRLDVRHRDGYVLISPRDREAFIAALRQRAPQVHVADSADPTEAARASRWVVALASVGVAVAAIVGTVVILSGSQAPTVKVERDRVTIRGSLASMSFSPRDVVSVSFSREWPAVRRKLFGFAAFGSMRGRFRLEGLGDGHVFAEAGQPSVLIRTFDSFVIVGFDDEERTRRLYDELQALAPR